MTGKSTKKIRPFSLKLACQNILYIPRALAQDLFAQFKLVTSKALVRNSTCQSLNGRNKFSTKMIRYKVFRKRIRPCGEQHDSFCGPGAITDTSVQPALLIGQ